MHSFFVFLLHKLLLEGEFLFLHIVPFLLLSCAFSSFSSLLNLSCVVSRWSIEQVVYSVLWILVIVLINLDDSARDCCNWTGFFSMALRNLLLEINDQRSVLILLWDDDIMYLMFNRWSFIRSMNHHAFCFVHGMTSSWLLGWSELLLRTVFSVCDSDFVIASTMVSLAIAIILSLVNQLDFHIFFLSLHPEWRDTLSINFL